MMRLGGVALVFGIGLFLMMRTLLITEAPPSLIEGPAYTGASSWLPDGATPAPPAKDTPLIRQVLQQAQTAGVKPADALFDEAVNQYNAGRLLEAARLFAATLVHQPEHVPAKARLGEVQGELEAAIARHRAEAERLMNQLRYEDSVIEWERVLLLLEPNDPRVPAAKAGLDAAKQRVRRSEQAGPRRTGWWVETFVKLHIYRRDTLERTLDLTGHDLRIGRGAENDVVLEDADKTVSRFHAELRFENDEWILIDLNSQNGSWIDGERIQRASLSPGMTIALGHFRLVLEDPNAPLPQYPSQMAPAEDELAPTIMMSAGAVQAPPPRTRAPRKPPARRGMRSAAARRAPPPRAPGAAPRPPRRRRAATKRPKLTDPDPTRRAGAAMIPRPIFYGACFVILTLDRRRDVHHAPAARRGLLGAAGRAGAGRSGDRTRRSSRANCRMAARSSTPATPPARSRRSRARCWSIPIIPKPSI